MKHKLRYLPSALALAALPLVAAAQPQPQNQPPSSETKGPNQRFERRVFPGPREGFGEKESVTFLGVETDPVSPTLSAQLNLPRESGLVLVTIAPDSPAATALKSHDILLKLDDQLLVDPRQLSVLVRNHKDGDEVTLTYIRGGKETTAKVKLGKHDVPKMAMGEGFGRQSFDSPGNPGGRAFGEVRGSREEMSRVLSLIDRAQSPGPGGMPSPQGTVRFYRNEGPGFRATAISTANSNMVFSDDQGTIDLTIKEGKKTLVAKNAKGEQIFSGAVDTPEQRQSLPAEVRERLERIEGMQGFSFQTDQDFVPGTVRIGPPPAQGIGTPMPAPAFNEPAPRIF